MLNHFELSKFSDETLNIKFKNTLFYNARFYSRMKNSKIMYYVSSGIYLLSTKIIYIICFRLDDRI